MQPYTFEQEFKEAKYVVYGTVKEILDSAYYDTSQSMEHLMDSLAGSDGRFANEYGYYALIEVYTIYKGDLKYKSKIKIEPVQNACEFTFRKDEPHILFVHEWKNKLQVGFCSNSFRVNRGSQIDLFVEWLELRDKPKMDSVLNYFFDELDKSLMAIEADSTPPKTLEVVLEQNQLIDDIIQQMTNLSGIEPDTVYMYASGPVLSDEIIAKWKSWFDQNKNQIYWNDNSQQIDHIDNRSY